MKIFKRNKVQEAVQTGEQTPPAQYFNGGNNRRKKFLILIPVGVVVALIIGGVIYKVGIEPGRESTYLDDVPGAEGKFSEEQELALQRLDHDPTTQNQSQDSKEAFEKLIKQAEAEDKKNGIDSDGSGGGNNNGGGGENGGGGGNTGGQTSQAIFYRIQLAEHCYWIQDYQCSIDSYERVIAAQPKNAGTMTVLAQAYFRSGNTPKAKETLTKAKSIVDSLEEGEAKEALLGTIKAVSSEINS